MLPGFFAKTARLISRCLGVFFKVEVFNASSSRRSSRPLANGWFLAAGNHVARQVVPSEVCPRFWKQELKHVWNISTNPEAGVHTH